MTSVELIYLNDGCVLECRGHANFAPHGQDIVCAGVSALCIAFLQRMQTLEAEGVAHLVKQHVVDGELSMEIVFSEERVSRMIAQSAVETAAAGFRALAEMYPNNVEFAEI